MGERERERYIRNERERERDDDDDDDVLNDEMIMKKKEKRLEKARNATQP